MKKTSHTILFDANPLMVRRTGVGYYIAQLVEQLAAAHPETMFIGYYYNFLGRKGKPTVPLATNISYRPVYHFPGPIINLLRRFNVEVPIELLVFKRADFIWYPNFLSQPSLLRTPSAITVHDLTFLDLPDYVARKNQQDLEKFIPRQIKHQRFIATVSQFTKERIHDVFQIPNEAILVTPIAPPKVEPGDIVSERETLKELGIPGKYIFTLGTVEPRKNILNMLDAFESLPTALQKKYTFVIAGKIGWNCAEEVARLEKLRRDGANVLHLGYVSEKDRSALYRNAAVFTTASFYEGFGMPTLEAMSFGIPCAISDIPVFREAAEDAALYFDQQNPSDIAKSWKKLLMDESLRHKFSRLSIARAATFNWKKIADSLYTEFYKHIS